MGSCKTVVVEEGMKRTGKLGMKRGEGSRKRLERKPFEELSMLTVQAGTDVGSAAPK